MNSRFFSWLVDICKNYLKISNKYSTFKKKNAFKKFVILFHLLLKRIFS